MALVLNDRVKVTTTTSGTGAFALGAAANKPAAVSALISKLFFIIDSKEL